LERAREWDFQSKLDAINRFFAREMEDMGGDDPLILVRKSQKFYFLCTLVQDIFDQPYCHWLEFFVVFDDARVHKSDVN